jgi:AraC family transcriptional regulator
MLSAVHQAISSIHERYDTPLTLNELAAEVFVSPFHFSRIFARVTGVTPGRYLTAVRLFEAKRLLLTTSLTVSDIVCSVGYSSVGTFTSRFTRGVGMTPTQYRVPEVADLLVAMSPDFRRIPSVDTLSGAGLDTAAAPQREGGALVGQIEMPDDRRWNALVGVFADPVPQRGPVAFSALAAAGSGELIINNVPPGRWVVIAAAQAVGDDTPDGFAIGIGRTPVVVTRDETVSAQVRLRALQPTDPPIAVTLAGTGSALGTSNVLPLRAVRQAA